jgi:hypothetical protein
VDFDAMKKAMHNALSVYKAQVETEEKAGILPCSEATPQPVIHSSWEDIVLWLKQDSE